MHTTNVFDHDSISAALNHYSQSCVSFPRPLLSFDESTGWIVAWGTVHNHEQNIAQLCWLPVELRGQEYDAHESMFVIASETDHRLTIIDFKPMLIMLHQLGVML
jgi:hypothetical protein